MKPGGGDRRHRPCRQSEQRYAGDGRAAVTGSIPSVIKADFKRAGFVLAGSSDILRNPADDHSLLVFDPKIRGKTDRASSSSGSRVDRKRRRKSAARSFPRLLGAGRARSPASRSARSRAGCRAAPGRVRWQSRASSAPCGSTR